MKISSTPSAALASQLAPGNQRHDEWIRVRQVVAQFNISRTTVYSLLQQGVLRSVCLRKRGNIRGIRLISRLALNEHLENLAGDQKEVRS